MRHKTKILIYNIAACALLICALAWILEKFIHLGRVEYTDNAQVKQLIVPIHSRVQGFVREVRFEDYQKVRKGDTLVIIEDTEFRYRLAQAQADYANACSGRSAVSATMSTTDRNIAVNDAGIEEARIKMENAEREYRRYENLYKQEAVTKQQLDAMQTNYDVQKAHYEMLQRQRTSTISVKQEQHEHLDQSEAAIGLAKATIDLAKLNLSYTIIVAPCDGTTGRKNIQTGQFVQQGQSLVDIVASDEVWIVANYKETQTKNIADGMKVNIEVDAVPDVIFTGVVSAVSQATGAAFSLLPQDNSAGNFVKVEQRIPVRIDFDDKNSKEAMTRLRAGMNAECEVNY